MVRTERDAIVFARQFIDGGWSYYFCPRPGRPLDYLKLARSRAIVGTGALARVKEKEMDGIFRTFRALIHRFSNLRAAPGAIYLTALQAGIPNNVFLSISLFLMLRYFSCWRG